MHVMRLRLPEGACLAPIRHPAPLSTSRMRSSILGIYPPAPELAEGARRSFVHNERRIWKPTLNGISYLTSLKRKRRNNV